MDRELGVLGKGRAILSLALVGAAIGLGVAPFAYLLWQTLGWMSQGSSWDPSFWYYARMGIPYAAKELALLGAFSGGSFGALLLATREKRGVAELPIPEVGVMGGLAGAVFLSVHSAVFGGEGWLPYAWPFAPAVLTALLGAGLTTGMVAMAKRAPPPSAFPTDEERRVPIAAFPKDS